MAAPQELLRPSGFHVTVFRPEEIYHETDTVLFDERQEINYTIGNLDQPSSFLPHMRVDLVLTQDITIIPLQYSLGYVIEMSASYEKPQHEYWNVEEIKRLQNLIAQKYPDHLVQNHSLNGIGLVTVKDPNQQWQYFVFVGLENEKKKRELQMQLAEQDLRFGKLSERDYAATATTLYTLQETNTTAKSFFQFFAGVIDHDSDPFDSSASNRSIILDTDKTFTQAVEGVAEFFGIAVNAAAQVKADSQTGILKLHPILTQP